MHDDIHVLRLAQMEACFADGQIPCRWAADLGFGFGQPLFNFYSPLSFYAAMIFRFLGFSLIDSIKTVFLLSLVVSGIFMYLLVKEFFGKWAALASAVLYVYAPYRAVNVFVRGAFAEAVAITFIPIVFLSIYKLISKQAKTWFVILVFSLASVFLSHNITTMISAPFFVAWAFFWLWKTKRFKSIRPLALSVIFSFCLAAFFLLPVVLEKQYVTIDFLKSAYNDYRQHFVYFGQLFLLRYWDYGPSLGKESRMSFQIGWPHWWTLLPIPFLFLILSKKKKIDSAVLSVLFFGFVFGVSVFLTHWRSGVVWKSVPLLSFVQFPWRFLGLACFSAAFVGGGLIYFLQKVFEKEKMAAVFSVVLIVLTIALNYSFFRPQVMHHWLSDEYKLSGQELESQMKSAFFDFLPKTVKIVPQELSLQKPLPSQGVEIADYLRKSNSWQFKANVSGENPALVEVPVFYFPGWKVFVDGVEAEARVGDRGLIGVDIPPGEHLVLGKFTDTPVRAASNIVSLFALLIIIPFCLLNPLRLK